MIFNNYNSTFFQKAQQFNREGKPIPQDKNRVIFSFNNEAYDAKIIG